MIFFFLIASVCSARLYKHAAPKQANQTCQARLNSSLPQTCNRSVLTGDIVASNEVYARNCIPACIDPYVQFYQCIFRGDLVDYFIRFLRVGTCGVYNGEYCPIRFNRLSDSFLDTCPFPNDNAIVVCNSTTPQSCYNNLATYSSMVGCCATGLFRTQNCRVTFDPPCSSPANGLYPFAALSMIAVALLGVLF